MSLRITDAAVDCFKKEWGFSDGEFVRIFVRYMSGGSEPFALGIQKDRPRQAIVQAKAGGITFFMEESDEWYIDGHQLTIDAQGEDIQFHVE